MPKLAILRSLYHRPFLFLWLGQTVSRLGDSMHRIALVWWVLEATGSGLAMGTVVIFQTVPMLLFVLFGGVVVDRFDRLKIMVVSDVVRGLLTGALAFLATQGRLELWHVYIASGLFGFVDAFFQPAYAAIVPRIARADELTSANAVTALSAQVMRVVGPALGALLVTASGTSLVFFVDALTFVASAGFLVAILNTPLSTPAPSSVDDDFLGLEAKSAGFTDLGTGMGTLGGGTVTFIQPSDLQLDDLDNLDRPRQSSARKVIAEVRVGFAVVLSQPYFWMPILVVSFINTLDYSAFLLAMPYLLKTCGLDVAAFGILQSLTAVGLTLSTVWLGQRSKLNRRGLMLFAGAAAMAVSSIGFGLPVTIIGIGILVVIRAIAGATIDLTLINVLQDKVPADKLGRVFAIESFLSMVFMPLGLAIVGWATDHMDPRHIFIGVGTIGLLIAIGLRHPKISGLD